MDKSIEFDTIDLTMQPIPPRSRLFHLEPVGVGTPYVESLTSYLIRLAQEHSVTVSSLIIKLLDRSFEKEKNRFLFANSHLANGHAPKVKETVRILEQYTLRKDLRFLSMINWSAVIASRNMFKYEKAWCPLCFEEMQNSGIVYEPLIWAFNDVLMCNKHNIKLYQKCPFCSKELSFLHKKVRPGYCYKCGSWLGVKQTISRDYLNIEELKWQNFVVSTLVEMLTYTPKIQEPLRLNNLSDLLLRSSDELKMSINDFSRTYNLRNLVKVLEGKRPNIRSLLKISFCLGVSVVDIFTKDLNELSIKKIKPPIEAILPPGKY